MHRLRLLALFLLGAVVHVESLGYWFVAVDSPKLILSSRIAGWGDAVAIFTQPLMHETEFTTLALFYRPLASLSYSVDYWVWGVDPFGYHLTNLLLQGVAVVSVAVVVGELTRDDAVGQLTAALFALHPLTAEVVPAAPRRHDILMLIFLLGSLVLFVRSQRERRASWRASTLSLGGSLVAYVLALGSKEPAVIVPALVFGWTALQHFDGDPFGALWASVRATVPFGVVTAAYLAIRVSVLGSLGGYRGGHEMFENAIPIAVGYFVSVAYPADVLGLGLAAGGRWIGVGLLVGVLLALVVVSAVVSVGAGRVRVKNVPLVALIVGACVLIAAVPWLGQRALGPIGGLLSGFTPIPYPPRHTTAGLLLGGTCLVGGLWALRGRSTNGRIDAPALAFFIAWFVLPLALYARGDRYLIRTGYASIVPAMAILSVLLVSAVRALRASDRTLDHNAVLVGSVLLVLVPQIAVSPLFHPYDGWRASGEVNRMVFNGLADELADDGSTTLRVHGLPSGITSDSFPGARSVVYPGAQATGSWLKLFHPNQELTVHSEGRTHLQRVPEAVSINTTRDSDTLIATLHYEHNDTERVAPYRSHEHRASATAHSFRSVGSSR